LLPFPGQQLPQFLLHQTSTTYHDPSATNTNDSNCVFDPSGISSNGAHDGMTLDKGNGIHSSLSFHSPNTRGNDKPNGGSSSNSPVLMTSALTTTAV
jgi:hypothetical protein